MTENLAQQARELSLFTHKKFAYLKDEILKAAKMGMFEYEVLFRTNYPDNQEYLHTTVKLLRDQGFTVVICLDRIKICW